MLREFIKCASTLERAEMLQNTTLSDWSDEELNTIIDIMGIKGTTLYLDKEDKVAAIARTMSSSKEIEKQINPEFEKVDILSMKNNDIQSRMETIYRQF